MSAENELPFIEAQIPYLNTNEDRIVFSYEQRSADLFPITRPSLRIHNGRMTGEPLSLDQQGFMLINSPSRVVREHLDALVQENSSPSETMGPVSLAYLAELEPLMFKMAEGAREVFAQYGTVTVRFSQRAKNRSWLPTAQFAHLDFERSDIDRLLRETLELTGHKIEPFRRQVMLQGWRVLTPPPQDNTLALCDVRSVSEAAMINFDYLGPKGSRNELIRSRACRFEPQHEWYYFPNMTPDELLVFKGFDSDRPDAMSAMHSAFDHPNAENANPRGSIECRFIALYD